MVSLKTAGVIIIGNEILSGKVRDVNSFYLVVELRNLGVDVRRISVIPDDIDIIGSEAAGFSGRYDYVFTSGGVGPTHDDVTMAGIARGFGVKLVIHPELEKLVYSRYKDNVNSAVLKIAELPEGAEIIFTPKMRFPVVSFRNIFIFPGIPEYLQNKFPLIKERFRSPVFYLKKFYLDAHESEIAGALNLVVSENPDVAFGSYPITGTDEYKVLITAESKSEESLSRAVENLAGRLPQKAVVRVE
ncbi:MAG: competence/damage-inducible protein A [Nitrospirae bacterium]|nr:competence/damage-inducible protein A [Nitrospirota bacterium]